MNRIVTVVLADDHQLLRQSFGMLLNQTTGIKVVSDVGNSDDAVNACVHLRPDVAVLDIDMPGMDSFEAARTIKTRSPRTRLLFLSAFTHDRYIEAALGAGALGYLTKSEPMQSVIQAIHKVALGQACFSSEIQSRIVIDEQGPTLAKHSVATRSSTLTEREREVLRYLALGRSKKEIARIMHLSIKTIENHTSNLMARLNIHDRVELARFAIREGLIQA